MSKNRNIPTRVGKSSTRRASRDGTSEHPHASGEKTAGKHVGPVGDGTSPREWGKGPPLRGAGRELRNIPTRVGKRPRASTWGRSATEHPHASGEKVAPLPTAPQVVGTSPREWGKVGPDLRRVRVRRNIPTRVGKSVGLPCRISTRSEHPHASGEKGVVGS